MAEIAACNNELELLHTCELAEILVSWSPKQNKMKGNYPFDQGFKGQNVNNDSEMTEKFRN